MFPAVTTLFLLSLLSLQHKDVSAFHVIRPQQQALARAVGLTTAGFRQKICSSPVADPQCTALHLFGFGGSGSKLALDEPVTVYKNANDASRVEFEGLGDYLVKWSKMFTNGGIKLTTPVEVVHATNDSKTAVRFLFKDTNTGYKNKSEESESGKYRPPSDEDKSKKKESKTTKQGGVEIVVEKFGDGLQVVASRCEIDADTIIKEMSEETILKELQLALDVWKRETKGQKK